MIGLFAIVVTLALASAAQAQTPDIFKRLMGEPLTLFDWGLMQLDRDLERASLRVFPRIGGEPQARSGTTYDWREGRVWMSVALALPRAERTEPRCAAIFQRLVRELTFSAPKSPDAAGWYLQNAFQPKARFWTSRFEDVGAKLLEVVWLEVSLRAPNQEALAGDSRRLRCAGRLDAAPEALAVELQG